MKKTYVTLDPNAWHTKFMKLVLGSASPTPQNINNFCPYWWLLMFCFLTCLIIVPIRLLGRLGKLLFNVVDKILTIAFIEPAVTFWEDNLTDLDVYQIWTHNQQINKLYKKYYYSDGDCDFRRRERFVEDWWTKKYKQPIRISDSKSYYKYSPEFIEWQKKYKEELQKFFEKNAEDKAHRQESSYGDKLESFRENVGSQFEKLKLEMSSWKNIIRWTKRVVGLIVTVFLLVVSFFAINFLGKGTLWLIDNWNWEVVGMLGIGLGIILIAIILMILLAEWVKYMSVKGTKLWYVKVIYTLIYWIVWMPLKVVLYYFLWQLLIVNLAYLIVGGVKLLWNGLLGFLGIFGEYFGASYTDYCPEIRWEEKTKK